MNQQQFGFTLYEVTLAIALTSVVAASAMPRWSELQQDADRATLSQLRSELKTAQRMHQLRQKQQAFEYERWIETEEFTISKVRGDTTVFSAPSHNYCFGLVQKPEQQAFITKILPNPHPMCQDQDAATGD